MYNMNVIVVILFRGWLLFITFWLAYQGPSTVQLPKL